MALGVTGPVLRSTGLPHDLRKTQPLLRLRDLRLRRPAPPTTCDSYGRFLIRVEEMRESLKIVEQCLDRLQPGPVMVADKKIAWPAQLALGRDGLGNSLDHITEDHGHLDGGPDPPLQAGHRGHPGARRPGVRGRRGRPRGELGVQRRVRRRHPRPYRVHYRDPSFTNLQAMAAMCEGGQVADVIVAVTRPSTP